MWKLLGSPESRKCKRGGRVILMSYIKDSQCSIQTPIICGHPEKPVYGKGISIMPFIPGKRETKYEQSIYLEKLLPLEEYDLITSPEAIAHIMTQKFVMGTPLYRQEQDWNRQGIMLSRQTMSNWLLKATEDWLEPIYDVLHEMLCTYDVLHADETTLQVLHEPGKTAQSKSYMWLYRTSGYNNYGRANSMPIVLYDYQPDRRAKRPAEFLQGFKGYLHTDGYDGYHGLPDDIVIVGCFAHARRKFDEALKSMPEKDREGSNVLRGKRYLDKLFELERTFADLSPKERFAKRQELAKPVLEEFFVWLEKFGDMTKTPLGKAKHYALGQRKYLERYLLDGRLEISNNRAERSITPFVIDRKNFLFANTPRGAKASAIMFSIIETAKAACP